MDDKRLIFTSIFNATPTVILSLSNALAMNRDRDLLFSCSDPNSPNVNLFRLQLENEGTSDNKIQLLQRQAKFSDDLSTKSSELAWIKCCDLTGSGPLLQLKLSETEHHLLGTTALGFCVWKVDGLKDWVSPTRLDLKLPPGVRNISVKLLYSNSVILSKDDEFALAGVRKNLYVWTMSNGQLVKVLDAHFGRILSLVPYTTGPWNAVITSSIDRTVKVWNMNNVFEQVHVIDRHELQIDSISLCQKIGVAVTVTRGCVGIWNVLTGKLLDKLAYNVLGAIVTRAQITTDGRYIVSSESGSIIIWEWPARRAIFRVEQPAVKQVLFLENDTKFLAGSRLGSSNEGRAVLVVRFVLFFTLKFHCSIPI